MLFHRRLLGSVAAFMFAAGAVASSGASASAKEMKLDAIFSIPVNLKINHQTRALIEDVNKTCKGLVQINIKGGPEAIPTDQQMSALKRGIVGLYAGAAGYYQGQVPELEALYGSNKTAMEQRRDGGHAMLDGFFQKRVNGKFLAEFGSGYKFLLLFRDKPNITADGILDIKGMKVRGTGTYKPFYEALGVNMVSIYTAEVHSALERGLVDAVGWVTMSTIELGWTKFIKHRLEPYFMQGGNIIVVNLDKWKAMSSEQQTCLNDLVIKHEVLAHKYFVAEMLREVKAMEGTKGVTTHTLTGKGAKKYLDDFQDNHWKAMVKWGTKQETVDQLKKLYFDSSRAPGVFE
jgi:TRAP-type mannitol/chloroaromatic compound transport system substrate-binding protein